MMTIPKFIHTKFAVVAALVSALNTIAFATSDTEHTDDASPSISEGGRPTKRQRTDDLVWVDQTNQTIANYYADKADSSSSASSMNVTEWLDVIENLEINDASEGQPIGSDEQSFYSSDDDSISQDSIEPTTSLPSALRTTDSCDSLISTEYTPEMEHILSNQHKTSLKRALNRHIRRITELTEPSLHSLRRYNGPCPLESWLDSLPIRTNKAYRTQVILSRR